MTVGGPVTWRDAIIALTIATGLVAGGWTSGFWMGTYFVSRADLERRVLTIEKGMK